MVAWLGFHRVERVDLSSSLGHAGQADGDVAGGSCWYPLNAIEILAAPAVS